MKTSKPQASAMKELFHRHTHSIPGHCPINARAPRPRAIKRSAILTACIAAAICVTPTSEAATVTWSGATDADWSKATNWNTLAEPGALDDVLFPYAVPQSGSTVTLQTGELARSLSFDSNYTLTGGSFALSSGEVTVVPALSVTISSVLEGTGGLSLPVSNGLAGAELLPGGGKLTLTGTNTYSGATSISAGVLSISSSANLGNAAATNTIAMSGGTLQNTGAAVVLGPTRTVQITSSGAASADGAIFDVTDSNTLTVNGVISGSATDAITKVGSGTLILSGNNSNNGAGGFTGRIVIKEGFLQISNKKSGAVNSDTTINLGSHSNEIVLDGGGIRWRGASGSSGTGRWTIPTTQVWSIGPNGGTIDIPLMQSSKIHFTATQNDLIRGTGTITRTGLGPLTIENSNPNFTGDWVVGGGVLEARGTAALGNTDPLTMPTVTVNEGGELANAVAAAGGDMANAITMNGGAISPQNFAANFSGAITFNVVAPGKSSFINLGDWWQNAARNGTFSGQLTGAGAITVAKGSFGTNPFIAPGGGTTQNTGTLFLTNPTNSISGQVTINNNLKVNTTSATNVGSTIGTADFILAGGSLLLRDNGTGNDSFLDYTGNDVMVVDNAGGGATVGVATLDVNRASANSGNTFVLGSLTVGSQQLNVTGANGYSAAFAGNTTLTGNAILNTTTAGTVLRLAGDIGGSGGFTKTGPGRLDITGIAAHAGPTNIDAGTVSFSGPTSFANSPQVNVANGATLDVTAALAFAVTPGQTLVANGTVLGPMALSGTLSGTGNVGALALDIGGTIAPGSTVGILNTGSLDLDRGTIALEIESLASFDQVNVAGTVLLNGPVNLTLALSSTFSNNTKFSIINNDGGEAVSFADAAARFVYNGLTLNEGGSFQVVGGFGSQYFQISYAGGDGNDVELTAIPEPASAPILLAGFACLLSAQRLRRRRSA